MTWTPPPRLLDGAPPTRLVLFDIDGTLLVASNLHREAFFAALKEFFDVRPLQAWKDYAGRTDPWILKDMLRLAGKDPALLDPVMAVVQRFMVEFYTRNVDREKVTVVPGVQHLLSLLDASGIMRGLVTGNLEPIAFLKLQSAGLAQGFATGGFGSDHEDRSRLIEIAIERATRVHGFTFTGKNVIYIGDTPRDVVAARQAGVPAAVMRTVINASEDFTGAEPDVFVDPGNPEPFISFIEKSMNTVSIEQDMLDDLLDTKLSALTDKINAILKKWNHSSIEAFLASAADGSIEEAEPDVISLTNLLARREPFNELKQRYRK